MKPITSILYLLIGLLVVAGASGQNAQPSRKCPQLVIACPLETVEQDTQLRFSAMVAGSDAALTYTWSLTAGRISEGQGTPSIMVDTTAMGGRRITAKVLVGGLAGGCQSALSCAVFVMKPIGAVSKQAEVVASAEAAEKPAAVNISKPADVVVSKPTDAQRLGNYGDLTFELEKDRLAGFAKKLRSMPDEQGYIIVYGGRCGKETQALERAERAKEWLINKHGIDASRIVTIDGGYREALMTEIFIGPVDATLPELESSVQPLDQSRCKQ